MMGDAAFLGTLLLLDFPLAGYLCASRCIKDENLLEYS